MYGSHVKFILHACWDSNFVDEQYCEKDCVHAAKVKKPVAELRDGEE